LITDQAVLAVERAGGFVGEHQLRVLGDAAGDGHPLLLAAGEFRGPLAQLVLQAHFHQCVDGPLAGDLAGVALVFQDDLDLLLGGERREQVEALEDEAAVVQPEAVQLAGAQAPEVLVQRADLALVGLQQARRAPPRGSTCPSPTGP
jgi:hypothetical protein